jgi:hypothetical protein
MIQIGFIGAENMGGLMRGVNANRPALSSTNRTAGSLAQLIFQSPASSFGEWN